MQRERGGDSVLIFYNNLISRVFVAAVLFFENFGILLREGVSNLSPGKNNFIFDGFVDLVFWVSFGWGSLGFVLLMC